MLYLVKDAVSRRTHVQILCAGSGVELITRAFLEVKNVTQLHGYVSVIISNLRPCFYSVFCA